jgi:hypothetical protein
MNGHSEVWTARGATVVRVIIWKSKDQRGNTEAYELF